MSDLFLLVQRHEEAHRETSEGDAARALTGRGRAQMHQQARTLFEALPALDHVLASPKVRTVQTAEILVGPFDHATPLSCHHVIAEPPSLQAIYTLVMNTPAPNRCLALVGHEPTLSTFVRWLVKGQAFSGFRTGQSVLLKLEQTQTSIIAMHHAGQALAIPPADPHL